MYKISLDKIQNLFAEIAKNENLYLPIDNTDGSASYGQWREGVEWSNNLNTTKSPKDFFFPQTEDLMKFKTASPVAFNRKDEGSRRFCGVWCESL